MNVVKGVVWKTGMLAKMANFWNFRSCFELSPVRLEYVGMHLESIEIIIMAARRCSSYYI